MNKSGYLSKYSDGNRWKQMFVRLTGDSTLAWFDSEQSGVPRRQVALRNVAAFLAFGPVIRRLPFQPAALSDDQISRMFAVPHEPSKQTRISFFMAASSQEASDWINAITSTLQQGAPPSGAAPPYPQQAAPPAAYPTQSAAPPYPYPPQGGAAPYPPQAGFSGYGGGHAGGGAVAQYGAPYQAYPHAQPYTQPHAQQMGGYPRQAYPAQPAPPMGYPAAMGGASTTVIIDKKKKKKHKGHKSKGFSNAAVGLAAGAAGMYVGSRMFGHGCHGGWGGGWGSWSSLSSFGSGGSWSWSD